MRHAEELERPVIGITMKVTTDGNRPGSCALLHAQNCFYSKAVRRANGTPLFIPPVEEPDLNPEDITAVYQLIDGLLLAGGDDVDPGLYGQQPYSITEKPTKSCDVTDQELLRLAGADKKALLAICRGMQLWNVATGGSLYQYLPDDFGTEIDHIGEGKPLMARLHAIKFETASRLGKILLPHIASGPLRVNSHHHQAINRLGNGLRPVAWSTDGLIEAVETTNSSWFAVGVQWHPETNDDPASTALMEEFVEAARRE